MPADTVLEAWERRGWLSALLRPAAGLFAAAAAMRRTAYRKGWARSFSAGAPVVIVGNITVGGTGKTPVTGWLAQSLAQAGRSPAIVSRGYGGRRQNTPVRVTPLSDAGEVGDEPVLLAKQAECPVWVCIDRASAARTAVAEGAEIVLSDDGLQHYRMARDFEICVVDGDRGLGNGLRLPAGPLRESSRRLGEVDEVLVQGMQSEFPGCKFELRIDRAVRLDGAGERPLTDFAGRRVLALAGIGFPRRFHAALRAYGLEVEPIRAPDHGRVSRAALLKRGLPVIMTAKDAVKYSDPAGGDLWWTPATVYMPESSRERVLRRVLALLDKD
ncbi:MAG: tetraacyldisaccharide 4'-kinase [Gammaproteobacteria bacterium]|nr:tetraacyldisaccharide 4'-kinase [Gammaproteobacteria bacterium]MYD03080.1 tetraacyldisaccharide 4'-kinase [Gammaproteobacteria bacterium]MYI25703.1 tetraacyldisaccharide 4'-kinase [Gammaproteobacteria bacterium]